MAGMPTILSRMARGLERRRGLLLPLVLAGFVLAILVPIPPAALDVLLALSLAMSAVVLLSVIFVSSPLELSLFPTVLLVATLGRLVLGVAATRLILTCGASGAGPEEAHLAAGSMVWGMADFLASSSAGGSGSPAAALGVLVLLVLIQLLVVAKGAGRISEVAARFALDAMPGKQMAIDSDYAAGNIPEEEARLRRGQVSREADFYGAMDGAAKFLWGDAIAAGLITLVCLLGGFYVGLREYGWSWADTATLFTRLAVGVGLATQVPAMLLAVASSILIGRSAGKTHLAEEFLTQLFRRPVVLGIAAAMTAGLFLTSLPKLPLALVALGLAGGAWALHRRQSAAEAEGAPQGAAPALAPAVPRQEEDVTRLLSVDPLRLDLGYALVGWAGEQGGGELLQRIAALRSRFAQEMGVIVPPIRIRDEKALEAHSYAIFLRSARVASGKIYANLLLAVGDGEQAGGLLGRPTQDPVFGTPAVWIQPDQRDQAEALHYVVISPLSVLATHLDQVIRTHAADLLTREQTVRLLDHLRPTAPAVVEEAVARLKVGTIHNVLQELLRGQVPIRDLEAILESLTDAADVGGDIAALAERCRARLARALSQRYCAEDGRLWCVSLDPQTEEAIGRYVSQGEGWAASVPPAAHQKLSRSVGAGLADLERQGRAPVLVCAAGVRWAVQRLISPTQPRAVVLGYNELESVEIESVATIGTEL
jgi:flagellar biosynthesis protein FlhA